VGLGIIAASYLPLLALFFQRLWLSDNYGFFPLVLVAVGVLLYQRGDGRRLVENSSWGLRDWLWFGTGWLLLAAAVWLWSPWVAAVSAIITLGAVLWRMQQGWQLVPVWLLLWLIVPLPVNMDTRLVLHLQGLSSRAGSLMLDFLGYNHVLSAHVIETKGHKFMVEEACSGIRSLFVLLACAAIFAVWQRRGIVHTCLLLAAAVFWATTLNVVRVGIVVISELEAGIDVSVGWRHELLGCVLFALALWMLWCSDRLLQFLLEPIPQSVWGGDEEDAIPEDGEEEQATAVATAASPPTSAPTFGHGSKSFRPRLAAAWLCGLFPLLGVAQLFRGGDSVRDVPADAERVQRVAATFDENSLPANLGEWQRKSYETSHRDISSIYGEFSRTWTYDRDTRPAIVSFDFPFLGWHQLTNCYALQGWEVEARDTVPLSGDEDEPGLEMETFELTREGGERAWLLLTHFDHQGQPLSPPDQGLLSASTWQDRTAARLSKALNSLGVERTTYQLQLFLPGRATAEERRQAQNLLRQAQRHLQARLAAELSRDG